MGGPCYTHGGENLVGLGAFKSYFGLWFCQGALLPDPEKVLINAQKGKTRALRQWRFTDDDVDVDAVALYVKAAIEHYDRGEKITPQHGRPIQIPSELNDVLDADLESKKAFDQLTPGKRREYANHVAEAKRADTKMRRVEKILPMIQSGVGLHDKYR